MQHTQPAVNQILQNFEATSEVGRKRQTEVLDYIIQVKKDARKKLIR